MADLRPSQPGSDSGTGTDRAQLVLVTALIIGVALIALVLLVNAAIYTENLATRDPDVGDEEALSFEAKAIEGVGGIVDRENHNEYETYEDGVKQNVTDGIVVLNDHLRLTSLDRAVLARINLSTVSHSEGLLIRHTNESRAFTSANGSSNWTLAENLTQSRSHVATIHESELIATNASNASSDGAFTVILDGNSGDWHAYVYTNDTTGDIAIAIKPGGVADPADATVVCSVDSANATIDFTAGTIDGKACPGMQWGEGIGTEYDIRYENGDRANGTYEVTVNGTESGALNTDSGDSPYYVPAVYSTQAQLNYRSPDLEYKVTVRVARGEPDA